MNDAAANPILAFFAGIGAFTIATVATVGRVTLFAWRTIVRALAPPYYPIRLLEQLLHIGWYSLPVVGLTALFTGAALAQQIYVGGSRLNAQSAVPAIVVIGIVRELGPVLIFGGYLLAVYKLGFNATSYLETSREFLEKDDLVMSLVKAAVFGFFVALMGCYHGFRSEGGAAGVGKATTNAVVSALVLILLANLLITIMAFG